MDSKKIEELLNKYWNCETSLEEEQQLKEYFKSGEIPEQLKDTAALFQYFDVSKKKSLNDIGFDNSILNSVAPKKGKIVKLVYNSMRIAAGIAVLVAAVWFVRQELRKSDPPSATVEDTYDDPKLAFEETKKALMMISKSFGKAEEQARKLNMFNEAQEGINKTPEKK
ncbi:hypothetical protein [Pseudochryseolinea flava]|uniref:Uncharacterized protein n=1 Tax=Pseudochryseolinea flava TaxID=2059302 RepID=A0A364XZU7_9BACT|nr:hypothetical protein [Pseudochryseolinea flava]RAV99847.1 hypothetical protein DQQ10_17555 [Pseudochryseolinea flava]